MRFTPAFRIDSGLPLEVHPMANGKFIAPGIYEKYRYCVLDSNGQVHSTLGEWPYRDKDEKTVSGIVRSQAYMFGIASSPSKTKIRRLSYVSGYAVFLSIRKRFSTFAKGNYCYLSGL